MKTIVITLALLTLSLASASASDDSPFTGNVSAMNCSRISALTLHTNLGVYCEGPLVLRGPSEAHLDQQRLYAAICERLRRCEADRANDKNSSTTAEGSGTVTESVATSKIPPPALGGTTAGSVSR